MDSASPYPIDRRQQHNLRAIFEQAYSLCVPYLDPARGINGHPLTRHVGIVLREHYPALTGQDMVVLISTLQSTFRVRNTAVHKGRLGG